jgi:hypothetical protein
LDKYLIGTPMNLDENGLQVRFCVLEKQEKKRAESP